MYGKVSLNSPLSRVETGYVGTLERAINTRLVYRVPTYQIKWNANNWLMRSLTGWLVGWYSISAVGYEVV